MCGASNSHEHNALDGGPALQPLLHFLARSLTHLQSQQALTVVGTSKMESFGVDFAKPCDLSGIHIVPEAVWTVPLILSLLNSLEGHETVTLKRKRRLHAPHSKAKQRTSCTGVYSHIRIDVKIQDRLACLSWIG
jgi:hypothetical protein